MSEVNTSVKVYSRLRPSEPYDELGEKLHVVDGTSIAIKTSEESEARNVRLDGVFLKNRSQADLFEYVCEPLIDQVFEGNSACCIAYGTTNSGKTYTVFGSADLELSGRGLAPRVVEALYDRASARLSSHEFGMEACFYEIYTDQIRDLGKAYKENLQTVHSDLPERYQRENLEIREHSGKILINGITTIPITFKEEILEVLNAGWTLRQTSESDINPVSSRSHTVLTITLTQRPRDRIAEPTKTLFTLVDLAGSERIARTHSEEKRIQEAQFISSSLQAVNKVLSKLFAKSVGQAVPHVPFRDSKLTRLLQNVFCMNSVCALIATINPSLLFLSESINTLQYVERCISLDSRSDLGFIKAVVEKASSHHEQRVKKLEEEIIELRGSIEYTQARQERSMRELGKILGLDEDLMHILEAVPGSKEKKLAQHYRESVKKAENITVRNKDLEKRLESNKVLLEDIKRVEINNHDKHALAVYELEVELREVKRQIASLQEQSEQKTMKQQHDRAEELQKMLIHSHMLLEEKAAIIHNLPNALQSHAADLRNLADMHDMGKNDGEVLVRKRYREEELGHKDKVVELQAEFKAQIKEKQDEIELFEPQVKAYLVAKEEQIAAYQAELVKLYNVNAQASTLIRNIEEGAYNGGIRPVLVPSEHHPVEPIQDKFPQLFKALARLQTYSVGFKGSLSETRKAKLLKTASSILLRTKDSEKSYKLKLPEARYEEPVQLAEVDLKSALESDVSTMRVNEIKKLVLVLRTQIQAKERNLQRLRMKQAGSDTASSAAKEKLDKLMVQRDKYQKLYTREVQKKLDSKAIIESQKRVLDKQFFMTSVPSRPSTTGMRPKTNYSQQRPKETSLTEIVRPSQNPVTLRGIVKKY
mmetsp:Transcript_7676/g.14485  ORF Transcript_7676/g.14485 Transcript_7676/m.14485 type:complete len:877 (-) Transcript_7676:181-2811(-)